MSYSKPDLPLVAAKLRRAIRGDVRFFLLLHVLYASVCAGGLEPYARQFVVTILAATPRDGVRVTYLGTNGYQFEFKGHALLVDPYFSRVDLLSVALGSRIQPNASRINDGLPSRANGCLEFRLQAARHRAREPRKRGTPNLAEVGRDSGNARTFRSPAGCPGCDGKDTGASHCVGIQCRPCQTRRRFIRRRSKTGRRAANRSMENSRVIRDTRSVVRQSAI